MAAAIEYGDLTNYGGSKFQKVADLAVWRALLEGFATEEVGDTEYEGTLSLLRGPFALQRDDVEIGLDSFGTMDQAFLAVQRGAVIECHPSGAVDVQWYEDYDAAADAWSQRAGHYEVPGDWYE